MDQAKFFFSYARKDSEFVLRLAQELRAVGAELWLDQLDIQGGQHWDRAIEEALKTCPGMLVVLSPESLASNNVMDEVSYALEERKLVIPILFRSCEVPFRLRRVQHVDFTASYETGLERLLKALQIERPPTQVPRPIGMPNATPSLPQSLPSPPSQDEAPPGPEPASIETPLPKRRLPRWARGALVGFGLGALGALFFAFSQDSSFERFALGIALNGVAWAITGAFFWQFRPRKAVVTTCLVVLSILITPAGIIVPFLILAGEFFRRLVERRIEKTKAAKI